MLRLSHYKGHLIRRLRCSYGPVSQPGQRLLTSDGLGLPSQVLCTWCGVAIVPMRCTTPSTHTLSHRIYHYWDSRMALTMARKAAKFKLCHTGTADFKKESKSGRCGRRLLWCYEYSPYSCGQWDRTSRPVCGLK
ncbi:hypothetical protein M5D96_000163 [Drosophila gunungcola]|uniref:Uncharacterized protein n=1 Tax=Drosophila gunungcola TaxID=103775 RepID=A0A9Q0BU48_9MUSC|nr:hypothetical protein M5D96_000163 [Drosophila gunungcola]